MRWVINSLPLPVLILLIVGGLGLFAAAGLSIVHRRFPELAAGEHNDVAGVLLGVVGVVYGIVLAFVMVVVFQDFTDTEANVRAEASSVAQLVQDTESMSIASAIAATANHYVHAVVEQEWPAMAEGSLGSASATDVDQFNKVLQGYEPVTNSQVALYDAAIADLDSLIAERGTRLFEAQHELPPLLLILILGGAVLVVAFTWLFGMRRFRTQAVMVVGVAVLIAFVVLITVDLDHPFSGQLSVSSSPFKEGELARFWE